MENVSSTSTVADNAQPYQSNKKIKDKHIFYGSRQGTAIPSNKKIKNKHIFYGSQQHAAIPNQQW